MNEFQLIETLFANWSIKHPSVQQSIGDDCLVWSNANPMVISTDTAVAGRHFPETASPEQVAQRAFLPAISDIAAMAAKPAFFTLAISFPERYHQQWLIRFAERLRSLAEQYQIMLAGGDTTASDQLTITISVHGTCLEPVLRSGAKPGDKLWTTGQLGQAAAALPFVLEGKEAEAPEPWINAYWQPRPPISFAQQLQGRINSAIDLSDGLIGDASHIAKQSQCELAIQLAQLPLDPFLKAKDKAGLKLAIAGGDDYQLLFSASPEQSNEIQMLAEKFDVQLTAIGDIKEGKPAVRWYDGDQEVSFDWQSFTHF